MAQVFWNRVQSFKVNQGRWLWHQSFQIRAFVRRKPLFSVSHSYIFWPKFRVFPLE